MRKIILWLAVVNVAVAADPALPTLDELKTPSSPAFALAGIAPTNIERPGSAKAFGLALLNASVPDKKGGVPRNVALQFSPYWWVDHPDLTFDRYYAERTGLPAVLQTLSISAATYALKDKVTNDDTTGAGLGLSFDLIRGEANPQLTEKRAALAKLQRDALLSGGAHEGISDDYRSKLSAAGAEIESMDKGRVGWQATLAGAVTYRLKDNKLDQGERDRAGAWLTVGYKPRTQDVFGQFTFLGLARYTRDNGRTTSRDIGDFGGRVLWRAPTHPFAFSAEYIHRETSGLRTHRLVALAEYRVTEDWCLFISHGKTFSDDFVGGDLVSVAGVSFLWGKGPQIK